MRVLSHQVMDHLNLGRRYRELVSAVGERLKAEEALLASQTKFQQLCDCTTAGIYIYSGERFLYANPAATTITGYTLEELQSLSLWDLVHPDFHENLKAWVKASEAGDRSPARLEFSIIAKGGTIRWVDFSAAFIEFEGQPSCIGTAIDRTQRKQAEALNQVQRQVLEMISRNKPLSDVMHAVIQLIEALSDQGVCTILLLDPATGTLRNGATSTMPDDFCRAVDGAPVGPQVGSCGTAAHRKATVIVTDIASDPLWEPWAEARRLILSLGFNACTSTPILDSRGDVLGTYAMYYRSARGPTRYEVKLLEVSSFLLGIALDRQRKDEALRVSEERMDAILSNSPLLVFVKDRAGRYLFTNRTFEQRFHLSQRQAIGHTDAELFAPDQAMAFQANDEQVLRTGMPMEFEERVRYDDGDHTSIASKFPLRQPDGTIYAVGGILTDITERRRMEQELSESRERFVLAVAGTTDGIWDWNIVTNEDYLSPRWKELLGYEDHELPNRAETFFGLLHPDDMDGVQSAVRAHLERREPYSIELRLRRKDGSYAWFLSRGQALWDADGRPIRMVGAITDITERKQAEAALRRSREQLQQALAEVSDRERLLQAIFNSEPECVKLLDAQGLLLSMNRAGLNMLEADSFSQVKGHCIYPLVTEEYREQFRRLTHAVFQNESGSLEFEMVGLKGSRRILETHACPLHDQHGGVQALLGITRDITEKKRVDEALRESESCFRAIVEQAAVGVAQIETATGRFIRVNQKYCDIVGLSADEMTASTFLAITHPDDRQPDIDNMTRLIAGDIRTFTMENRYIRRDGSEVWVHLTVSPLWKLGDQPDFHIAVVEDITERKRAEQELQRSCERLQLLGREVQWAEEKERRRLSRELHDEFGQLLSALRLSLARVREELEKRRGTKGSVLNKNVMAATKSAEHLFVSLRQLVHGLRPAVLDEFGLVSALESMAEDMRHATGLDCRLSTEPNNVDALIEQEMKGALFRIAQELVTNVVRHAKATKADIALRCAQGKIALTVQDNGRGGLLTSAKGTYGLRGIRERTELLGGAVEIRSERRRGTTVTVIIPLSLQRPPGSKDLPEALVTAEKPQRRRHEKNM